MRLDVSSIIDKATDKDILKDVDLDEYFSVHMAAATQRMIAAVGREIISKVLQDIKVDVVVDDESVYLEMYHGPSGEQIFKATVIDQLQLALESVTSQRTGTISWENMEQFSAILGFLIEAQHRHPVRSPHRLVAA